MISQRLIAKSYPRDSGGQLRYPADHRKSAPKWADSLNHTQIRRVNAQSWKLMGGERVIAIGRKYIYI